MGPQLQPRPPFSVQLNQLNCSAFFSAFVSTLRSCYSDQLRRAAWQRSIQSIIHDTAWVAIAVLLWLPCWLSSGVHLLMAAACGIPRLSLAQVSLENSFSYSYYCSDAKCPA